MVSVTEETMHSFFAYLARMRQIRRWGLMRNTFDENVQEHSLQVAHIAHCLAIIRNRRYSGGADPARAVELAVYHDTAEVITGDLPTPIKYFSASLTSAYGQIEQLARNRLLAMLPEDLRGAYEAFIIEPEQDGEWQRVKAADRICAYLKCVEEERSGNSEFTQAKHAIAKTIDAIDLPEVKDFMHEFVPAFLLSLDELNGSSETDAQLDH